MSSLYFPIFHLSWQFLDERLQFEMCVILDRLAVMCFYATENHYQDRNLSLINQVKEYADIHKQHRQKYVYDRLDLLWCNIPI